MTDYARLNIYNTSWEKIAYIDSYTSLIWTRRFTTYGDFELYMPYDPKWNDIIKPDHYVELDGDPDLRGIQNDEIFAMIIERIEYIQQPESPVMMIIKGRCLESLLYRRVFYQNIIYSDSTTGHSLNTRVSFLYEIVRICIGNDALDVRKIPCSILDTDIPNPTYDDSRVRVVNQNDNLGECMDQCLSSWGYGIIVTYSKAAEQFIIRFYNHNDRTMGDNALIFRSDLDNLANCHYIIDNTNTANVARINSGQSYEINQGTTTVKVLPSATVPQGEDSPRGATFRGINRREVAFTSELQGDGNGRFSALQAAGLRQLRPYYNNKEITADIISENAPDYALGDVALIQTDFGISAEACIVEVTQSYSREGYLKYPVFGTFKTLDDVKENWTEN